MGPTTAVIGFLRQVTRTAGRARRSEYWWVALLGLLVLVAVGLLDGTRADEGYAPDGPVSGVAAIVIALSTLSLAVRRLHDTDRSGWWLLLALVPGLGWIPLTVFFVLPGTEGANRFGPSPRTTTDGSARGRAARRPQRTA